MGFLVWSWSACQPLFQCTKNEHCPDGFSCIAQRCQGVTAEPPGNCKIDGLPADLDSECCGQQRDDKQLCCSGNNCCASRNHSAFNAAGGCQCQTGYQWLNPQDLRSDKRCINPNTPTCTKDGEQAPNPASCCSKERSDQGICCTGGACCGAQTNSWTVSSGECECRPGFVRVNPNDTKDFRCESKGNPNDRLSCTAFKTIQEHTQQITSIAFHPNGTQLASASYDKTIRLYNTDGTWVRTFEGHHSAVMAIAFHPIQPELASTSADNTWKRWHLNDGQTTHTGTTPAVARSLHYHPTTFDLYIGSDKGGLLVKPDNTSQAFAQDAYIRDIAIHANSQRMALARNNKTIDIYHTNGQLLQTLTGHGSYVFGVSFNADGTQLASVSSKLRLWNPQDGQLFHSIAAHKGAAYTVAFHPTKNIVLTGGHDGQINIWNAANGVLLQSLPGHEGPIYRISMNATGTLLASGGKDKTLRLWNCQ
jgi:WD40 repeat protein